MASPGTELASLDFGNLIGGPLNAVITAQSMAAQSTAAFIKDVGFYPEGKEIDGVDVGGTPVYVDFKYPKEIQPYQPGRTFLKVDSIIINDGGSGYTAAPPVTFSDPGEGETAATATAEIEDGKISKINITAGGNYLNPPTVTIIPPPNPTDAAPQVSVQTKIGRVDNAVSAVFQDMKISVPILTMLPIPFIKVDIITIDFNAKITSMETQSQSESLNFKTSLEAKQRWPGGSAKLNASVAFKKSSSSGSSIERTYSMAIHVQASQDEMPAGMEKLLGILESAIISTPGAVKA